MKTLLRVVSVIVLGCAALVGVNAARLMSRQVAPGPATGIAIDQAIAVSHLAGAIRHRTITSDEQARSAPGTAAASQVDWAGFHAYLADTFPKIGQNLHRETVSDASLLYTWQGRRSDLAPLILTAHMDVVPAAEDTLAQWSHAPFDGAVVDNAVWGRGTLDNKNGVVGLLEAVDALLAHGFAPERTIYVAFGHNEEAGAQSSGASSIASMLKSRGVRASALVDEGGWIFDKIPGVKQHVALVGVAEKGYTSIELTVNSAGGHSSMPPKETAVGILARAVARAEAEQMPARLDGASAALFDTLAPEMSLPMKIAFTNQWLTRPLLLRELAKAPSTNAAIRTTTAATMLRASVKENVLASTAAAVLNFRLLPGDTADTVMAHLRRVINDDRVGIAPYRGQRGDEASPASRSDSAEFAALASAVRSVYPDVLVAPYLTLGATDARHYSDVADNLFRFIPVDQPGSTDLLHAPNEHINIDVYVKQIQAYVAMITAMSK